MAINHNYIREILNYIGNENKLDWYVGLDNYLFKGDKGGGDHPQYVYAYKITSYTRES